MDNKNAAHIAKVAVCGNTILDNILICSKPIVLDEKFQATEQKLVPGGQAATPADLLAKLGNKVFFVGAIGNNENAEIVKNDFSKNGVDYSYSPICAARHQEACIAVGSDGKRTIIFPPRDERLTCADAPLDWIKNEKIDIIYIDGHEPELETRAAEMGHKLGIPVVSDLEDLSKPHDFLDYVDVLIAPANVILQLAEFPNPAEADWRDITRATKTVAEMGFSGLLVPEDFGGSGLGCVEEADHLINRGNQLAIGIDAKAKRSQCIEGCALPLRPVLALHQKKIGVKVQPTIGDDARLQRAQRSRSRVAWIDGRSQSLLFAFLVQSQKGGLGHHRLAAHFKGWRQVGGFQFFGGDRKRHAADSADV